LDKSVPSLKKIDPDAPLEFNTHVELDRYVIQLMEKIYGKDTPCDVAIREFEKHPDFKDIYKILKGFDRAFRMLYDRETDPDSLLKGRSLRDSNGKDCCPFPLNEKTAKCYKRT